MREFIRRTPGLQTPQISKAIGVTVKTLENWLKGLRAKNKIQFRGSPKTGGYRAIEGREEVKSEGVNGGISAGTDEEMGGGIKAVVDFIERAPGLRAPQISEALGVPVKTLERWLRQLKARNQIASGGSR